MANLKDLLQDLYTKANAYDALNELVGTNGSKIETNISKLSTIDGQITDLYSKVAQVRDVKSFDNLKQYEIGNIIEVDGVLYKCIKANAPAGTPVTNTEFFVSIGGGSADLTAVNAQIASIKAVTDQIQFEDLELDGVTYSLVTKKPAQEETQEPETPTDPQEQTNPTGE
jgi:hypothetical protein